MDKRILRLAIPNIISNITVPLLGMVDMFIVGHLSSELFIGAIAVGTMIFNFIYWNFGFLRMGTSGFTAQAFGAQDKQETVNILLRSLLVAIVIGLLIVILQYFILQLAFILIGASSGIKEYASSYFYIYVWAAPAVLSMYAFSGWFVGMQDSKTPMYISIAVNVINICVSILLVFVLHLELKGVALGSLIAQYSGFILSLIIWSRKYRKLKPFLNISFIKSIRDFVPFFKVNSDIFLRTLALVAVTTFFTSTSAKMGDTLLAVNSLLMQLFILFSYMMDGFAYAAEALTGRYVGAKQPLQLKILISRLFRWGIGLMIFFTIGYWLFADNILGILTDKQNIINIAHEYRFWVLLIPFAGFSAFLWDGVFVGMTASAQMRNSMFVATASFFLIYYLFQNSLGNNALWLAFIIYLAMRGIMQSIIFRFIKKRIGL
ncbi:MATE family efflux transporter [Dysgonomonas sp. 216]|uniref:MATE family efflux transporter n=1 Tax=Dysgonomonas sp. 216 TaxID=2302934 RepID=UPI0013D81096|nr:MATE family efflux transporter [Dysgonomonas sp. 216]NDW18312.1 MATE family efflux transporter [Dysgonomonas sp. 216]NDW18680.1 MATE family efflux transporter [Dysgonomonas sp. 216]